MKRTAHITVALAAVIGCTVILPAIAQHNPSDPIAAMQDPNNPNTARQRRNRRANGDQPRRRADTMTTPAPMPAMTMEPVAPDFQRNIDRANQTLDNIVKLLDAIEARKAGTAPPAGQ